MSGPDQVLANVVSEIINPLYQLIVGITAVYFIYGVARYIIDLNNPEKQTFGKSHLLWGSIGLFIVVSVGGILSIIQGIFGGILE